jgi:FxLD family lantipeptide
MTQSSTGILERADVAETAVGFDEEDFSLDLRVVVATHPIAELMCDTGDGCGSTCSGSACSSIAENLS